MKNQKKSSTTSNQSRNQSRTSQTRSNPKGRKGKKFNERNNFQDKAEKREYDKGKRAGIELETEKPYNDIKWYSRNPQLLKQAAQFPFGAPAGNKLDIARLVTKSELPNSVSNLDPNYTAASLDAPGVMTIGFAPTIGISTAATSPINIASISNYDYVRKANSGARNYDWPDLTLMYMAMDSVYMYWNYLKRVYGLMMKFSYENRYTPKPLIESMGIDYEDLANNLNDFRLQLNIKAHQISSIAVPANMEFMVRHSWLVSNVFMDQETSKAQYYMFVPSWVYKYSERTSDKGGELLPVPVAQKLKYDWKGECTNKFKVGELMAILDELIYAILTSEDIGTMAGDILKAYGANLFSLTPVDENYIVDYSYSREVLMQIENLTVIPVDDDFTVERYKIAQDPNTNLMVWNPTITDPDMKGSESAFINVHFNDPTPEDVVEATRLTALVRKSGSGYKFTAVASEFVTGLYIHVLTSVNKSQTTSPWMITDVLTTSDSEWALRSFYFDPNMVFQVNNAGGWSPTLHNELVNKLFKLAYYANFDWAPMLRIMARTDIRVWVGPLFGDVDKYAIVPADNLQSLHLVCLMSMFDVPMS